MENLRTILVVGTLGLTAGFCQPHLGLLEVPASVQAGHEFAITVHGNDVQACCGGQVGCVVQLPASVALNGFFATSGGQGPVAGVTRDRPSLLAMYRAEPGYYLASFDARFVAQNAGLTLFLQAPAVAPAPLTVKVSLVGDFPALWTVADPPGITNFAAIGGVWAKTFTLVPDPPRFDRVPVALPAGIQVAECGDVDGDGRDDLVGFVLSSSSFLHACLSRPGAAWQTVTTNVVATQPGSSLALDDFDGDGHLDAAIPGQVGFGDGQGGFTMVPLPNVGFQVYYIAAGDVDGDGIPDLACVGQQTVAAVLRSNGDRTFANWSNGLPTQPVNGQYYWQPLLHDFTHDGLADLVVPRYSTGALDIFLGDGHGNWTPTSLATSYQAGQLNAGDLSGDGRDDLVVTFYNSPELLQVFEYLGGNQWGNVALQPVPAQNAARMALLDYDRDGRLDIAATDSPGYGTNTRSNRMRLLRNTGTGSFVEVPGVGLSAYGQSPSWLATGDIDGDTFPDLAMTTPVVWRNTGSGLSPFGSGCAAVGHAPWLDANSQPQLGNGAFALQLHDGVANGAGFVWLGFSKRYAFGTPQLPYDLAALGAPGCAVLAEQVAVRFVLHDALGLAVMAFPLPNDPTLHDLLLFSQGAALVPGANPLGALFSAGLAMRLD